MKVYDGLIACHFCLIIVAILARVANLTNFSWWWMLPIWLSLPAWTWAYAFFLEFRVRRKMKLLKSLQAEAARMVSCTSEFDAFLKEWNAKHSM